jgi:hypothetical protein
MTTTDEARELRQELAGQERGRGKRYDRALRARIVSFAEGRRAEGQSWAAIAGELGARFETVRRWCQRVRPQTTAHAVRAVKVVSERAQTALTVVSHSGLRVEGARLDEVIAILRTVG